MLAELVNDTLTAPVHDAAAPSEMATHATTQMVGEEEYKEGALSNILMCPDCKENPPNLTEEFSSGDVVCMSCGVVVRTAATY